LKMFTTKLAGYALRFDTRRGQFAYYIPPAKRPEVASFRRRFCIFLGVGPEVGAGGEPVEREVE
jgi:hypothetical protein